MDPVETAVAAFKGGVNCAQAIVATFGPRYGLDESRAQAVALPFGGGIAHTGRTCGAVAGALMVVGLRCASAGGPIAEQKKRAYARAGEFIKHFKARTGADQCRDLLDCDISTPEGMKRAQDTDLFKTRCPAFVQAAAEILQELLAQED